MDDHIPTIIEEDDHSNSPQQRRSGLDELIVELLNERDQLNEKLKGSQQTLQDVNNQICKLQNNQDQLQARVAHFLPKVSQILTAQNLE